MDGEPSTISITQPLLEEIEALVTAAKNGDATALPRLRDAINRPHELWPHLAQVNREVVDKWVKLRVGTNQESADSIRQAVDELRIRFSTTDDSPLVQLVVERVVTSWLVVTYFEAALAVAAHAAETQVRYLSQQLDHSQRRHLAAVKALDDIRKLLPRRKARSRS